MRHTNTYGYRSKFFQHLSRNEHLADFGSRNYICRCDKSIKVGEYIIHPSLKIKNKYKLETWYREYRLKRNFS